MLTEDYIPWHGSPGASEVRFCPDCGEQAVFNAGDWKRPHPDCPAKTD